MAFSEEYYLRVHGEQKGPYTLPEIQQLYEKGFVPDETLYWRDGMEQWQFVTDFCGKPRQALQQMERKRWLPWLAVVLILLGIAAYFFPMVREGWKEAYERDFTAEAAYWKARGFVRNRAQLSRNIVDFDPFEAAQVTLGETEGTVTLRGHAFDQAGQGIPARWQVKLSYLRNAKEWRLLGAVRL